jgi:hypothetical protein
MRFFKAIYYTYFFFFDKFTTGAVLKAISAISIAQTALLFSAIDFITANLFNIIWGPLLFSLLLFVLILINYQLYVKKYKITIKNGQFIRGNKKLSMVVSFAFFLSSLILYLIVIMRFERYIIYFYK